jgi:tetratricopeptide (TPR) repeat protein
MISRSSHAAFLAITSALLTFATMARPLQENDPKAALARGDYRAAENAYRDALKRSPNSAELLADLGIAVQMQGRGAEAIVLFRKALRIKPTSTTYALLAEERCKTRDMEEARPMLANILREHRSDFTILSFVAPCYLEADEPVESVEVYQALSASADFPRDQDLVQVAKSFVAASQYFVQKLKDAHDSAGFLSALVAARDGGSADARSAFLLAAQRSAYFRPNADFNQALSIWRQHPDDASLTYQMAVLSGEGVIHAFQQCEREFPQSPWLERFRAQILASQGHQEEAVAILEKMIAANPNQPEIIFELGMMYRQLADWDEMASTYRQLLALHPEDERASSRLSEALLNLNQYNAMKSLLTPIVEKPSPPLWAVLDLAAAEQKLGESSSAIRILVLAEKQDPVSRSA